LSVELTNCIQVNAEIFKLTSRLFLAESRSRQFSPCVTGGIGVKTGAWGGIVGAGSMGLLLHCRVSMVSIALSALGPILRHFPTAKRAYHDCKILPLEFFGGEYFFIITVFLLFHLFPFFSYWPSCSSYLSESRKS